MSSFTSHSFCTMLHTFIRWQSCTPQRLHEAIDKLTLRSEVEIIVVEGGRNEHPRQRHVHLAREGKASRRRTENITVRSYTTSLNLWQTQQVGDKPHDQKKRVKLKTCFHCQLLTGVPNQLDAQDPIRPEIHATRERHTQITQTAEVKIGIILERTARSPPTGIVLLELMLLKKTSTVLFPKVSMLCVWCSSSTSAPSPFTKSMPPFAVGFEVQGRYCKLGPPRWGSCQPSSTLKVTSEHLFVTSSCQSCYSRPSFSGMSEDCASTLEFVREKYGSLSHSKLQSQETKWKDTPGQVQRRISRITEKMRFTFGKQCWESSLPSTESLA